MEVNFGKIFYVTVEMDYVSNKQRTNKTCMIDGWMGFGIFETDHC
jgi:hypothetical protein